MVKRQLILVKICPNHIICYWFYCMLMYNINKGHEMVRANCRNRLTEKDFNFIADCLSSGKNHSILIDLLTDEQSRDIILDDVQLFESTIDARTIGNISPFLYFYLLTRKVLVEYSIDDREVTDYVASVLAEFCSVDNLPSHLYLTDMMQEILYSSSLETFLVRSQLGNYALFLTGLFPDKIYSNRLTPSLSYYESVGQSNYELAAQYTAAIRFELDNILETLAKKFRTVRVALNYMADKYIANEKKINNLFC